MAKQRLEGDLAAALKKNDVLYHRIFHMAGMYTSVPGDFFIFTENGVSLVECKECRGKSFVFSRLTQRKPLIRYNNIPTVDSYVLICFWMNRKDKSYYFLIPINILANYIDNNSKKSANLDDMMYFKDFLVKYEYIFSLF